MTNPLSMIPPVVRLWLYVVYGVAGAVLAWTTAKGWTGADELVLYAALGAVFGLTSASNVSLQSYNARHDGVDDPVVADERGVFDNSILIAVMAILVIIAALIFIVRSLT